MSRAHTKTEVGRQRCYLEQRPAHSVILQNQLFATLWDLILCSTFKLSTFAPNVRHCELDIFNEMIPTFDGTYEAGEKAEEKHILVVSPKLIAYIK